METKNNFVLFLSTVSDEDAGMRIADVLVSQKLAACVSVAPRINSIYWWDAKIEEAQEFMIIGKSVSSKIEEIKRTIKENHSYIVPEIIFLPIIDGYGPYLEWIENSVK